MRGSMPWREMRGANTLSGSVLRMHSVLGSSGSGGATTWCIDIRTE